MNKNKIAKNLLLALSLLGASGFSNADNGGNSDNVIVTNIKEVHDSFCEKDCTGEYRCAHIITSGEYERYTCATNQEIINFIKFGKGDVLGKLPREKVIFDKRDEKYRQQGLAEVGDDGVPFDDYEKMKNVERKGTHGSGKQVGGFDRRDNECKEQGLAEVGDSCQPVDDYKKMKKIENGTYGSGKQKAIFDRNDKCKDKKGEYQEVGENCIHDDKGGKKLRRMMKYHSN